MMWYSRAEPGTASTSSFRLQCAQIGKVHIRGQIWSSELQIDGICSSVPTHLQVAHVEVVQKHDEVCREVSEANAKRTRSMRADHYLLEYRPSAEIVEHAHAAFEDERCRVTVSPCRFRSSPTRIIPFIHHWTRKAPIPAHRSAP